jgi:adenylyltransferase/sulfurtransferase
MVLMLPVTQAIADRAEGVDLAPAELARFSRHVLLPQLGIEGQKRLKAARILVVGAGGLGSPSTLYLAAAGVGTLGVAEFDVVDPSNLQRQILYATSDAGRPKLDAAVRRLRELNPSCEVVPHEGPLSAENAREVLAPYDIVLDGTDNFATRYLVNDACVLLGKPYVYGSIYRFDGQASLFYPPHGPCYRCLFPTPPPPGSVPSCAEGGVLGVLPGHVGTLQALEALKLALGIGEPLLGRLHVWDALTSRASEFRLKRDPACPLCGERPRITTLTPIEWACATDDDVPRLDARALEARLGGTSAPVLLDVRRPEEAAICRIAGSALIPLQELEARLGELPVGRPVVAYCKSGKRSLDAARLLRQHGFRDVSSLDGGILAWIDAVDPTQPKY